jgi:aryl-alcohol dehydrogenase-like predicted oxidoreductase
VAQADPDWATGSLSQTAVRALRSTVGITSVLVGMRRVAYVDDVLEELKVPIDQRSREDAWQTLGSSI